MGLQTISPCRAGRKKWQLMLVPGTRAGMPLWICAAPKAASLSEILRYTVELEARRGHVMWKFSLLFLSLSFPLLGLGHPLLPSLVYRTSMDASVQTQKLYCIWEHHKVKIYWAHPWVAKSSAPDESSEPLSLAHRWCPSCPGRHRAHTPQRWSQSGAADKYPASSCPEESLLGSTLVLHL